MSTTSHLWAVGYDDTASAEQARNELTRLAGPQQYLLLFDTAILVRHHDGSYTLNREPLPITGTILAGGTLGFLAGLVLAAPITGATVGAVLGGSMSALAKTMGIDEQFILDVEQIMKPGTCALLVLDEENDMDVILHAIRGLGGTVLKTNVDVERARLIQSTLIAEAAKPSTHEVNR
jgi:uncharacterized membrane protein